MGKIAETKLRREAIDGDDELTTTEQTARVDFYVGVGAQAQGDEQAYREYLGRCAEVPNLEDVWETHLARWETVKRRGVPHA